jgi:Preprotein translocase subunit SecF
MLRILHDTKIDFIRLWKITTVVTLLFTLPGLLWIGVSGYKYSIEFTGWDAHAGALREGTERRRCALHAR